MYSGQYNSGTKFTTGKPFKQMEFDKFDFWH